MRKLPPITFRLRLPGQWADAWLYKDHLLLWTRSGALLRVGLDNLVSDISMQHGSEQGVVAETLLFRNDWKGSALFKRMMSLEAARTAFRAALEAAADPVVVSIPDMRRSPDELRGERASGVLLDTAIYANRVFMGTTEGFFETYVNPAKPDRPFDLHQVLDKRTVNVRAKYAAATASANDEGLWFKPIPWEQSATEQPSLHADVRQLASVSYQSSFAGRNLLNYGDSPIPQILFAKAEKSRPHERAEFEDWKIRDFGAPSQLGKTAGGIDEQIARAAGEWGGVNHRRDKLVVIGNSRNNLLVQSGADLSVVSLRTENEESKVTVRRSSRPLRATLRGVSPADVLETSPLGAGFVVETSDKVWFVDERGVHLLYSGPVAKVRTFPDSIRYRESCVLVHNDGIEIVGYTR